MDILANAPAELKPVHGVVTALTAGMEAGQRAVFVEGARRELRELEAKLGSVGARWALEAVDALVGRVRELEARTETAEGLAVRGEYLVRLEGRAAPAVEPEPVAGYGAPGAAPAGEGLPVSPPYCHCSKVTRRPSLAGSGCS